MIFFNIFFFIRLFDLVITLENLKNLKIFRVSLKFKIRKS
jgi:hypothetical protein